MTSLKRTLIILCLAVIWITMGTGWAQSGDTHPKADWPQWFGPNRDGVYHGPALSNQWPSNGPETLWKTSIGQGFSGPTVKNGRVVLFHRSENKERVECRDATTGKTIWKNDYTTRYVDSFGFDEGPRATPLIASNQVFTLGADGILQALHFQDGKRIWQMDLRKDYRAPKGFFGIASSPMLEGNVLLVNVGGSDGAGIVGFDRTTGKLLWKATNSEASYASPTSTTLHGQRVAIFFNRDGLAALKPGDGTVLFEYPWRPAINASVNAATPLAIGNRVFISTSYSKGAIVLEIDKEFRPRPVWAEDGVLSNHYSSSVHHKGYLYGLDGRQERGPTLRCVDLASGKVQWSKSGLGSGSLVVAGEDLLMLSERGQLLRIKASDSSFKLKDQAQVLGLDTRAYPALAQGKFYARDKRQFICLQLQNP